MQSSILSQLLLTPRPSSLKMENNVYCSSSILEYDTEEGSSLEWECDMSEEEEDLILRMYKLIGNKWSLIAGRIPGRKAEEIERYWAMRTQQFCSSHGAIFANNKQIANMISIPYHINGCNDVEVNS